MPSAVRWVVVDAEAMTHVDYTAARVVMALKKNLTEAGVELAFARLPWDLRSDFDRHHLMEAIGQGRIYDRLHDAIAAFEGSAKLSEPEASQARSDGAERGSGGQPG
jgi:MFS superfamily sulfate permease-like transporter